MEHPFKRRKIGQRGEGLGGDASWGTRREQIGSLGDSHQIEQPLMPKLVPHGQPGHPIHGDQVFEGLEFPRQKVERPHWPLESIDIESTKLYARQLTPANTNAAVLASDVKTQVANVPDVGVFTVNTNPTPTSKAVDGAGDRSTPGLVTPPAAVAASIARGQAIQTEEGVGEKELAHAQASASSNAPADHLAASPSSMVINVPDSSSQYVMKAPLTPITSNIELPTTSYFSSSPTDSATPSPQHSSPTAAPQSTLVPNAPINHNSTISGKLFLGSLIRPFADSFAATTPFGSSTSSLNPTSVSSEASISSLGFLALPTASQSSLSSRSASLISASTATQNPTVSIGNSQNPTTGISSGQITSIPATPVTSVSSQPSSQASSTPQAYSTSVTTSAGGTGISGNTATDPSATSNASGSAGSSGSPPTPVLVGGIVGGVAGLAMVLLIILLLSRWRRGKLGRQRTISPPVPQTMGHGGMPQAGSPMTQRSSTAMIGAATGLFNRLRPASSQTAATTDTAPSERGFQKISGRKLPSVLTSGGDGYGNSAVAGPSTGAPPEPSSTVVAPAQGYYSELAPALRPSPPHSLSGSSFYRGSHGFYGGVASENEPTEPSSSPGSSTSPTYFAPLAAITRPSRSRGSPTRHHEVANMRPGPARMPVINQPGVLPTPAPSRVNAPQRPARASPSPIGEYIRDGLGRSHASQDGSRGSRFREDTTPP